MQKTKNLLFSGVLAISLAVAIQGCGGSGAPAIGQSGQKTPVTENTTPQVSSDKPYIKKKITHLENEPSSFRKYALAASGQIKVRNTLTTDGPLADVHANGPIVAKTRSLDISGKITSKNQLTDAITRSYDYQSNLADDDMITIRALKVSEYLNLNNITEYIHLSDDGKITKVTDAGTQELSSIDGVQVDYKDGTWTISGSDITIKDTLKVDGNLKIDSDYTFVSGALLVTGNLQANGELNINVGTPFDSALVVNNSITVNKLTTIGRIHASGDFTAKGKLNIIGNAEIDGNVDLYDDAKINMLDNVYKAALADAQEESEESGIDLTLAHAQLFSDVKGNNSVMLFTFVEGNYLMDEHTINKLIESGDIKDFKFRSYLYGASIRYVSQLSKTDGLSRFYKNLLTVKKELGKKYGEVKVKKYIDIAPSNLYCQFTDANGQNVGTYLIENIAQDDVSKLIELTDDLKQKAIEDLENPTQIDESVANSKIEDTNTSENEALNNAPAEYQEVDNNISVSIVNTDKEAIATEDKQTRVNEWVEYQELGTENKEVEVQEVEINTNDSNAQQRGWWKRLRRHVKKWFRRLTLTDCHKKVRHGEIDGVNTNTAMTDIWGRDVSLFNAAPYNYCTPTAAAMVMQYNVHVKKHKPSLYSNDGSNHFSGNNPYVAKWAGYLHTGIHSGTSAWNTFTRLPYRVYRESKDNGLWGWAFSYYTAVWNRWWQFRVMKWYLGKNMPGIYHAPSHTVRNQGSGYHSMPIIGWKTESYSGWCAKRIWPNKNWFLLDTEFGFKQYVRFDSRSRYWKIGAISYIWSR